MRGFQGPVQKDVLDSRFRTVFRVRNFGGVFGNLFQEPIFEVRFQMLVSESGLQVLVFMARISRLEVHACRVTFAKGLRGTGHAESDTRGGPVFPGIVFRSVRGGLWACFRLVMLFRISVESPRNRRGKLVSENCRLGFRNRADYGRFFSRRPPVARTAFCSSSRLMLLSRWTRRSGSHGI